MTAADNLGDATTPLPVPRQDRLRAALWMIGSQAAFALMAVLARGASRGARWQELAAFRFLGGLLVAGVAGLYWGSKTTLFLSGARDKRALLARASFGTLAALGTFYTLHSPDISLGDATTLFAISPFFVALLAPVVLSERFRPRVGVALLIAAVGVGIVAKPTFDTAPNLVAAASSSAFWSACAMMALRLASAGESPESIAFFFHLMGLCVLGPMAAFAWSYPSNTTMLTLLLAGVSGGVAQLMMTRAYALDLATRVSVFGYSGVLFTRICGALVFGERFGAREMVGTAAVVVAGIVLTARP